MGVACTAREAREQGEEGGGKAGEASRAWDPQSAFLAHCGLSNGAASCYLRASSPQFQEHADRSGLLGVPSL